MTAAQKRKLDARLAIGLADVKAGRVHGPFNSAKEASAYIERVARERNTRPKTVSRKTRSG